MARFHAYKMKTSGQPIVDLQADLLGDLASRVVAPLIPIQNVGIQILKLNPRFEIGGEVFLLVPQALTSVPANAIGEQVADFSDRQDEITAALDFLFQGF